MHTESKPYYSNFDYQIASMAGTVGDYQDILTLADLSSCQLSLTNPSPEPRIFSTHNSPLKKDFDSALPRKALHGFKEIPNEPDPDILFVEELDHHLLHAELYHIRDTIGPDLGADEVFWPNVLWKVLYLAHLNQPDIFPDLPEYPHSCPDMDALLMGAVPHTTFLDVSRAGFALGMPKAWNYAEMTMSKYLDERGRINYQAMDPKTSFFVHRFGLIGCMPLMDRPALFEYANRHDLEVATIGGSSIAECMAHFCRSLGNEQIKKEIEELAGGGWLTRDRRSGTNRIDARFRHFLNSTEDYRNILIHLNQPHTTPQLQQLLDKNFPNQPHQLTRLLTFLMMKMVKDQTTLPRNHNQREKAWLTKAYGDPKPSSRVSTRDNSEIVVSHEFGNSDRILPALPWKAFVLVPHAIWKNGEVLYQYATLEQLYEAAHLIKQYYPTAVVYIPVTVDHQPLPYNLAEESQVKAGNQVSSMNAILSTIAHITCSGAIRHHYLNHH